MQHDTSYAPLRGSLIIALVTSIALIGGPSMVAQGPAFPLGSGPWIIDTYSPQTRIRVSVVASGIAAQCRGSAR